MRISLNWLSEYVALPEADRSRGGSPRRVRDRGDRADRAGKLAGVVAARIVASEHPNAEKLSVTRVDAGEAEPLQIVCGAKNYAGGRRGPARHGRRDPPRRHQDREGEKLRGVESFGMLCSAL